MSKIQYDGDIIVSAGPRTRLTPNFRAAEYFTGNDSIFVHRDLVAGVQMLRDAVGSLSIVNTAPRGAPKGYAVSVKGSDAAGVISAAEKLKSQGYFAMVEKQASSRVLLVIPEAPKSLRPVFAFDVGLQVVADYETQGDPYSQVTGNFDGAGLSFGVIQFNFGSKTLQELFRMFHDKDASALENCFPANGSYDEFQGVLQGSVRNAVRWGDSISRGTNKHQVATEWKKIFARIGRVEKFRRIQMQFAYDKYGKLLMAGIDYLHGLSGIQIRDHRCLTALFDMCVQQGGHGKARTRIARRVAREAPQDELSLTLIAVEERAKIAKKAFRSDCLSRRLGILYREPQEVTLSGVRKRRVNSKLYLVKGVSVTGVDKYLSPPVLRNVG